MSARKIIVIAHVQMDGIDPLLCHGGLFIELSVPEEELVQLSSFVTSEFDAFAGKVRDKLNDTKVLASKPTSAS